MNIYDKSPMIAPGAWVSPSASVIGEVKVASYASIWCVSKRMSVDWYMQLCVVQQPTGSQLPLFADMKHAQQRQYFTPYRSS